MARIVHFRRPPDIFCCILISYIILIYASCCGYAAPMSSDHTRKKAKFVFAWNIVRRWNKISQFGRSGRNSAAKWSYPRLFKWVKPDRNLFGFYFSRVFVTLWYDGNHTRAKSQRKNHRTFKLLYRGLKKSIQEMDWSFNRLSFSLIIA